MCNKKALTPPVYACSDAEPAYQPPKTAVITGIPVAITLPRARSLPQAQISESGDRYGGALPCAKGAL